MSTWSLPPKQMIPQWLDIDAAREHCPRGASVWEWASNDMGQPDLVLASAGDVPTEETVAAAALLRRELPDLRVRVVNLVDLFTPISHRDHPHGLEDRDFIELFTENEPHRQTRRRGQCRSRTLREEADGPRRVPLRA